MPLKIAEYFKSIDCSCLKSCLACKKGQEKSEKERKPRLRPMPLAKMIAINGTVFIHQVGAIILFPFLPFMVHDFYPSLRRSQLGYQAGFLGAAFYIGNLPGTIILGLISDLILGRATVLLLSAFLGSAFQLLFGFSQNFGWALASRILWGVLGANTAVAKALLSDICEERDISVAFALYGACNALGRVTGSVLGGVLARPALKYEAFQLTFFCDFPYLLPCLVGAGLGFIAVAGGVPGLIRCRRPQLKRKSQPDIIPLLERKPQEFPEANSNKKHDTYHSFVKPKLVELNKKSHKAAKKVCRQLKERNILLTAGILIILSYVSIIAIELLPLLLVTDFAHGGYKMDDTEIGLLMMIATVVHLPFQLIIFPWLTVVIGYRHTFRIGIIIIGVSNFLIPFSTAITGRNIVPPGYNETYLNYSAFCNDTSELSQIRSDSVTRISWNVWLWLIPVNAMNIAGRGILIGCCALFINNAALPSTRGTINGIVQAVSTIGKILAPIIGGPVYAWSENNGLGFPLNFHFLFNVSSLILVVIFFLSFLFPKAIEHPRVEEPEEEEGNDDEDNKRELTGG